MPRTSAPRGIRPFKIFRCALEAAEARDFLARPSARVRGEAAFRRQKSHLLSLYAGAQAEHSFRDTGGQIFDCIPLEQQSGLRGEPAAGPPSLRAFDLASPGGVEPPTSALRPGRRDVHGNEMYCPVGCVAVRRMTLEETTRFPTLADALAKGPRRANRPAMAPQAAGAEDDRHQYAYAYQDIPNLGASCILNIWSPAVAGAQFSISQLWVTAAMAGGGTQSVEIGWHVFPARYGHANPVFFCYSTRDNYATGEYQAEVPADDGDPRVARPSAFVAVGNGAPLGMVIDNPSQSGGAQSEKQVTAAIHEGKWWLYIGGVRPEHAVGYFRADSFDLDGLGVNGARVTFGGETCVDQSFPPMGSGAFASSGYGQAAYQRGYYYVGMDGQSRHPDLTPVESRSDLYKIELQNSVNWGRHFFFGGPGNA